ncbi:hypothetical protein GPL15_23310 [Clostridium sp. MCC353]|uniref:hypothetical protein n=1 Tax=Clostridium sp. MCC353 TaxID=2592646 RepID=UPI001C0093B5|nr:hypothetical protein [Clostridium sp. MCC353]MBT9779410.1 hypothetical protein [Clostridium sp. MCC353]
MDLQGIKISNMTKFRQYFTLQETVMNLRQFLRDFSPDYIFYEDEKDKELYQLISYCEQWRKIAGEEGGFFSLDHLDEMPVISWKAQAIGENGADSAPEHTIKLNFQKAEELEKMEPLKRGGKKPVMPIVLVALCELAHCPCRAEELEECSPSVKSVYEGIHETDGQAQKPIPPQTNEDVFETDQGIIISPAMEHFSLRRWKPSEDERGLTIRTKRLIRESYSSYSGCTELNLVDEEGRGVPGSAISLEHEIYANFIGDRVVEFLPSESRCGAYRIYKTWDKNGKALLERDKNDKKQNTYQDITGELGRMSSFAAAEDGGFVGISDGRLLSYTSMVNLPSMTEETPVSICSKNGLYAILTDRGNVVSNFSFNGSRICMICMDNYGYLYALGRNGRVFTNYPKNASIVSCENISWIGFDGSGRTLILKNEYNEETRIDVL